MKKITLVFLIQCIVLTIVGYFLLVDHLRVVEVDHDIVIFSTNNENYGVMNTNGKVYYHPQFSKYQFTGDYIILVSGSYKSGYAIKLVERTNPSKVVESYNHTTYLIDYYMDYKLFHSNKLNKDILINTYTGDKIEINGEFKYKDSISYYTGSGKGDKVLFHNGYAIIEKGVNQYGIVDEKGNMIIQPTYNFISNFNTDGLTVACISQDCGIINTEGTTIKEFNYERYELLDELVESVHLELVIEKQDQFYGVKNNEDGSTVIPFEYDEISKRSYFLVKKANLYGLYNSNGQKIMDPIYDFITYDLYLRRSIYAYKGDTITVFDQEGNELFSCHYDFLAEVVNYYDNNVIFIAHQDGKYGFIDHKGNEITPIIYEEAKIGNGNLLVKKDDVFYGIDYRFDTGTYSVDDYEYDHFLTNQNEIIYTSQGSIYKIDETNHITLILNKFFILSKNNLFKLSGLMLAELFIYIYIKKRTKRKKEVEEFSNRIKTRMED